MDERVAANRANWDDRAPIHHVSQFYDVEGWLRDDRGPRAWEADVLGDVRGLRLVHLQCHFGLDTLAWARAGADVVGLDFSSTAIDLARDTAARAGQAARFVCADVYDAVDALGGETFDIVYVSLGALCWLPSVTRWAAQACALVAPGGRLFVHDGHPLSQALADETLEFEWSYFEEAEPYVGDANFTYTDADDDHRVAHTVSYEWNHSLGEIVNAVIGEGLRLDRLDEHRWTAWQRYPWLVQEATQRWVIPPDRPQIPLSFTLLASRD